MKKILYSILAILLASVSSFAQLMSDADHKTMMDTFANNVNTELTGECPQGMSLDQFKKNIVLGTNTLSSTAQINLLTYVAPLLTYANQFKTANNLTTTNNAELYFLSSFAPSSLIQNGKLVANTTIPNITGDEIWTCALQTFNTGGNCGISGLVSDKSDVVLLDKAATTFLTKYAGDTGVLVMIGGFGDCINEYTKLNQFKAEVTIKNNRLYFISKESFSKVYQEYAATADEITKKYFNPLYEKGFYSLRPIVTESNETFLRDHYITLLEQKRMNLVSGENDKISIFDFLDNSEKTIGDDTFAAFLNNDAEIQIADSIYKYTDVGLFISKEDKYDYLLQILNNMLVPHDLITETSDEAKQAISREYPNSGLSTIDENVNYFRILYVDPYGGSGGWVSSYNPTPKSPVYSDPNYNTLLNNLSNCTPQSGLFGSLFGDNNVCIDKYENRRRVKTKAFNYNYGLVYHMGVKCVNQYRGWTGFWRVEATDEIRLIVEAAQFEYDADKLSGNTEINNQVKERTYFMNDKKILYQPDVMTLPNWGAPSITYYNLNSLPSIFKDDLSFEFFSTGWDLLDSQIQNGIDSNLKASKLNEYFYDNLYSTIKSQLQTALGSSITPPANRTFVAKFPENGKIIFQKSVYTQGFNIGVREKTFDWGVELKMNFSASGDGSWQVSGGIGSVLARPNNFRVKIVGAARHGSSWHGSKFSVGIN